MSKAKEKEMLFWTKEEYDKFSDAIKDKPIFYYAFQVIYWIGIWEDELWALVKSDFDFVKRKLTISKSYQRINGEDMITFLKTEKSNRVINMPKFLCDKMGNYFGMFYSLDDDTRLFHISKSYLHHEMDIGCKKAGVKRVGVHDGRVIIGASQKKPNKIPYGIKALDTALFDKFQDMGFHSFEMLINFNSFGFFRDACRVMAVDYKNDSALQDLEDLVEYDPTSVVILDKPVDMLSNIAGGDYWKAIVQDYKAKRIDGYKAEQRLSTEYKQRLKMRYSYVLDMPIRLKAGSRPKYRMIHVCDHEDGCFLMAQNIQNRKDELYTNIQTGGQMSLFDIMPGVSQSVEGEWISRE